VTDGVDDEVGGGASDGLDGEVATEADTVEKPDARPPVGAAPTRGATVDRPRSVPTLAAYRACVPIEETATRFVFDAVVPTTETPTATFTVDGREISVSLPVNPVGRPDERTCTVTFADRAGQLRADVGFARRRRVAWTLEGLVKSDDVASTGKLFHNAEDVLYDKYQDPTAAALGGLTLHRIGRLRERTGWIENLARDFAWVVDGRVLLAAILSTAQEPRERTRGLDGLLSAAPHRPLFGDGFALMLDLLRRWPDGAREGERRAAIAALPSNPATVDWDAMALTTSVDTD
jgi:hypothetical protein